MPFEIKYDDNTACMMCHMSGKINQQVIDEVLSVLIPQMKKNDCLRILNDLRDAEIDLSTVDIFNLPKMFVKAGIDPLSKRAVVVKAPTDDLSFFENVFVNQAQLVKVFTDYDEALKWLTR